MAFDWNTIEGYREDMSAEEKLELQVSSAKGFIEFINSIKLKWLLTQKKTNQTQCLMN